MAAGLVMAVFNPNGYRCALPIFTRFHKEAMSAGEYGHYRYSCPFVKLRPAGIQNTTLQAVSFRRRPESRERTVMTYHVYILASKRNGTLYVGVTNNLIGGDQSTVERFVR